MPITEQPTTYRTTDGQEFTSKTEAERHEALITATNDYNESTTRLAQTLLEAARTADGQLFSFQRWQYWRIHDNYLGLPTIERVSIYPSHVSIGYNGALFVNWERVDDRQRRYLEPIRVDLLYTSEREARKARLAACEQRIEELKTQLQEMRADFEKRR